jgi:hypothetical protein
MSDLTAADLAMAVQYMEHALERVKGTPPWATDSAYRDVAIIKVQEALWWTAALRDAVRP